MKRRFVPFGSAFLRFAPLFVVFFALSFRARADTITVSAAASLREVLGVIGSDFSRGGTQVRFNFGSSGALQQQIEAGAPVDLFIAASPKNIDQLTVRGEIESATQRTLARGELVLIAPRNSKLRSFADLRSPNVRAIAIGGPGVPAGDYARESLDFLRLSAALRPKFVFSKDVRAALNSVALGNADAGMVYKTDALRSRAVRIVALAPPRSHSPIIYPMALVKSAPNRAGALKFWRFLQNPRSRATLRRFGFIV